MTCHAAYESDRCHGNSFVYNRDSKLCCDLITGSYEVFCLCGDLVVDFLVHSVKITVDAVQKADSHGDGTHIQVFLLDHFVCFVYFKNIYHVGAPLYKVYQGFRFCALH